MKTIVLILEAPSQSGHDLRRNYLRSLFGDLRDSAAILVINELLNSKVISASLKHMFGWFVCYKRYL